MPDAALTDAAGSQPVVAAPVAAWDYDVARAPAGRKMLLLTSKGICVVGELPRGAAGYVAWSPLPARDHAREAALGLRVG